MITSLAEERAARAVRSFQRMQPILTSFVRGLTGKLVPVVIDSKTATDGRKIYVRPPIALGDDIPHERRLCDREDEWGAPLCVACKTHNETMGLLYHEIAHVAYGSFDKTRQLEFVIQSCAISDYAKKKMLKNLRHAMASGAVFLDLPIQNQVSKLNSFLPGLVNAIEDIRVDTAMQRARPGTARTRHALIKRMISDGLELSDGRRLKWIDQPLNSQAVAVLIAEYLDVSVESCFHEGVILFGRLPSVRQAMLRVLIRESTMSESVATALEVLVEGQKLGLFINDTGTNYVESKEERDDEGYEPGSGEADKPPENSESSKGDPRSNGGDSEELGSSDNDDPRAERSGPAGDAGKSKADSSMESNESGNEDGSGEDAGANDEPLGGGGDNESEVSPGGGIDGVTDKPSKGNRGDGDSPLGEPLNADSEISTPSEGAERGSDESFSGTRGRDERGAKANESNADDLKSKKASERPESASGRPDEDHSDDSQQDESGLEGNLERIFDRFDEDAFGTSREMKDDLKGLLGHDSDMTLSEDATPVERKEMDIAIVTAVHFDSRSVALTSVDIQKGPNVRGRTMQLKEQVGESILGPSLLHARRAFADNLRANQQRHRKSGRVDARTLGKRAWNDDERLFKKRTIPGKKDWAVLIGIDISGSTSRRGILEMTLLSAYAQAELCQRLGLKFAVYAHTGNWTSLIIQSIKDFDEPWTEQKVRDLGHLRSSHANLDGHTLEFYRKRLDGVQATNKVLMYYSDGAMPAENYDEELEILLREIKVCEQRDYILMAVGINSDDPAQYGMDTVRVDSPSDISKVVQHLGKRIATAI